MRGVSEGAFTRSDFVTQTGADADVMARLDAYAATLAAWNETMNLVSPASMADLWRRHMFDSAQLVPLIPNGTRRIVDMGSGAGFPGLVLAAMRPDGVGLETVLVESIEKKCAFLRAAATAMGLDGRVRVIRGRAEEVSGLKADMVTARAMAPLSDAHFHAPRVGFFPSLAGTLNHVLAVDIYYLAGLHGEARLVTNGVATACIHHRLEFRSQQPVAHTQHGAPLHKIEPTFAPAQGVTVVEMADEFGEGHEGLREGRLMTRARAYSPDMRPDRGGTINLRKGCYRDPFTALGT